MVIRAMTEAVWLDCQFVWNERLGIEVPSFDKPWYGMTAEERASVVARWEFVRGRIPDAILAREAQIRRMLDELFEEEDFGRCCSLNREIAEAASVIHDLQIWYRTQQDLEEEDIKRHG
ncbi:hypothetical protein VQ071_11510 [Cohnella sp. 56]